MAGRRRSSSSTTPISRRSRRSCMRSCTSICRLRNSQLSMRPRNLERMEAGGRIRMEAAVSMETVATAVGGGVSFGRATGQSEALPRIARHGTQSAQREHDRRRGGAIALHGLCRKHHLHDALELDLDELGKHFLAQDRPQLGVERAGVEGVFAVVPVCLVRVPVGMFLYPAAAQASLAAVARICCIVNG